jgi:tRNA1Val (adenine37-N6)-methyltransferase
MTYGLKLESFERMDAVTVDTLFDGNMKIRQPKDGYRFAVDAVLLAGHVRPGAGDTIVDLGTGCGVIPLILCCRYPEVDIFGVELQQDLVGLAHRNVLDNRMTGRITILHQDMTTLARRQFGRSIQWIICNPPYRKAGASRLNPDRQQALARHELSVTLAGVIETAARLLDPAGRFLCIYPAERLTDLISLMRSAKLEPSFCRAVHPRTGSTARRVIVEGIKGGRQGLEIAPSLMIMDAAGQYTTEMVEMFQVKDQGQS